jgi:hypothetical protein
MSVLQFIPVTNAGSTSTYVCNGTYAWGYKGSGIGNVTSNPGGQSQFSAAEYNKVKVNDTQYVTNAGGVDPTDFIFHRFVFHINETIAYIDYIKIVYIVKAQYYATGYVDKSHGILWIKKDAGWSNKYYCPDSDPKVTIVVNITSDFADYIDANGNLTFAFQNDYTTLAFWDLRSYYAEVTVGYSLPPEITNEAPTDGSTGVNIVYGYEYSWALDLDDNGIVNNSDANEIVLHYGETGAPGWIKEDVDPNGIIEVVDVSAWQSHVVKTCLVVVSADVANFTSIDIYTNASGSWAKMDASYDDYYANMSDPGIARNMLTPPYLHYSTKYWWRINASNTDGWTNETYNFTTKAMPVTSNLVATADGRFEIDLTWTKAMNYTYIEWNTIEHWAKGTGTLLYNGTGTSTSQSGLAQSTQRYYQAWSYSIWTHDYSLTNISANATTDANQIITFNGEAPANTTDPVSRTTTLVNVTIEDPDGDTFNWTIETSLGDSASGNVETNGSKTCGFVASPLPPGTNITWWVNVTDSYNWSNATYWFVTAVNVPPSIANETPANGSEGVAFNVTLEINISDDVDLMDWTIETSWGNSSSGFNSPNATIACHTNGMNSSTNITWWVNVTDGYNWTNATYWFITLDDDAPTYDNYWVNYTTGINVSSYNATIEINGCNDTYPIDRDLNFTVIHNGVHHWNNTVSSDDGSASINITLVNGVNTLVFILEDWAGNNITWSHPLDLTIYNFICVDERTRKYINVSEFTSIRVTAPEINWTLNLKSKGDGNFTYLANTSYPGTLYPHSLRFEIAFIGTGSNITRYFDPTILEGTINTTIYISIPNGTEQMYMTTVQSTSPIEFGVWCMDSDAWILLDRTRMVGGLSGSNYAQYIYTIDALYYFRVYENGVPIVLTTLDGGKAVTIDLDVLILTSNISSISNFSSWLCLQKPYNTTLLIYFHYPANTSTKTTIEIYNATGYHYLWYNETTAPNEFFIYFDWSTLTPVPDPNQPWTIKATTSTGEEVTIVVIPNQIIGPVYHSPVALPAILALIICVALMIFGLTLFSSSTTFSFFGPVVCGIGIFITVLTEQVWYIHILQLMLIVFIIFMLLIWRYEYSTTEFSGSGGLS